MEQIVLKLLELDITSYNRLNRLIVYGLLAVAEISQLSVPDRFLMKGFLCAFFYRMHAM